MGVTPTGPRPLPTWAALVIVFGLFLTIRGYHSRDNDQAYRLPLLIDRQQDGVYARDPFVRAFDTFNPHRGSLWLLDVASRPFGLSFGLFALYAGTFALTFVGINRLARAVWPEAARAAGWAAFVLVLLAKAGNIGTNHLFEPILLDRQIALALGWAALAGWIGGGHAAPILAAAAVGMAAFVHPSLGLQLGMLVAAGWVVGLVAPGWLGVRRRASGLGLALLGVALAPVIAAMPGQGQVLLAGMPEDEFRLWTLYVQSPQHMVPQLWRRPQWLAWGCYGALLVFSMAGWSGTNRESDPIATLARRRFLTTYLVLMASLALAYLAVDRIGDLRVTLFQPFRMATVARGLALVAISGRLVALWNRGEALARARVGLIATGLTGDWSLVVATIVEVSATLGDRFGRRATWLAAGTTLLAGLRFLANHDTEVGHERLLAALIAVLVFSAIEARTVIVQRFRNWTSGRIARAAALAWAVPLLALVFPLLPAARTDLGRPIAAWLLDRCRFAAIPRDDIERLALWCRDHTPPEARFVGPPGPKTFRLWSLRALAFNRAGSPYHAAGLADWAERFRAHVAFEGTTAEFATAYLENRQALERRFDELDSDQLAELAAEQEAEYVLARSDLLDDDVNGRALEPLRVEGAFAVYCVRPLRTAASSAGDVDR